MHPKTISKEEILAAARELAQTEGLAALQIRAIAARAQISVGSVYHYFPHKSDLLAAVVASVWQEILHEGRRPGPENDFCGFLEALFEKLKKGADKYPGFFAAHQEVFSEHGKDAALRQRQQVLAHIRQSLLEVLEKDKGISVGAFSGDLTKEALAEFAFQHLLLLLREEAADCRILTSLLRRALYGPKAGDAIW